MKTQTYSMKPQTFALITAAVVGGTGLLGMISAFRRGTNDHVEEMKNFDGYSKIGGVIPTNDLFNWVRVGIGAAGLLASQNEKSAVIFNRTVAVSYAGMAVMGLIPKADTMFGFMPIFGANVALHGATAAAELMTEKKLMDQSVKSLKQAAKLVPFQKTAARKTARKTKSSRARA